jgi:hypothetical protein
MTEENPTIPKARTQVEVYLLGLLTHSRSCDGIRCEQCNAIDRMLLDGRYGVDAPIERITVAVKAVGELKKNYAGLLPHLDTVPMHPGMRRATHEHLTKLEKLESLIRLPITRGERALYATRAPIRTPYRGGSDGGNNGG